MDRWSSRDGMVMMVVRQRSVVTREGWYYLFILSFVILGSLLRNIQLLVGLSSVLATAMILNWRWTRAMMHRLEVKRPVPETLWAGRYANLACEITNSRLRLSALALMVQFRFLKQTEFHTDATPADWGSRLRRWLGHLQVQNYTLVDAVHPGETVVAKQTVKFHQRGQYRVGPVTVSTHFPLGLVRREWCDAQYQLCDVGPATGTLSQSWVEQMLGLGWSTSQQGQTARSGEEFFSLRPYSAGDSIRWIHWRASARHRALLVKQFQSSQSKAFSLVVDLGRYEDRHGGSNLEEVETLLRVLATISETVWSRGMAHIHLTLIADQTHSIHFPCDEPEWLQWHRHLSTARSHQEPGRLAATLKRVVERQSTANGTVAPLVVLAPIAIDRYVALGRELSGGPRTASAEDRGSRGQSAAEPWEDFWNIQQSVRSWFTPGDPWLASWYLDAEDDEGLSGDGGQVDSLARAQAEAQPITMRAESSSNPARSGAALSEIVGPENAGSADVESRKVRT